MASKPELRKLMANIIAEISEEDIQTQSKAVTGKILSHPKYLAAKSISLYLSTEKEIDTLTLLQHSLENDKKRCFIPYISTSKAGRDARGKMGKPRMQMIEIRSMKDYDELPVNKYGIKEPSDELVGKGVASDEDACLDLIIVPGVAFASDGRRIGHGRGYYDEFLRHLEQRSPIKPPTIGLALLQQMIDDPLSVEGHDYVIDEVITP